VRDGWLTWLLAGSLAVGCGGSAGSDGTTSDAAGTGAGGAVGGTDSDGDAGTTSGGGDGDAMSGGLATGGLTTGGLTTGGLATGGLATGGLTTGGLTTGGLGGETGSGGAGGTNAGGSESGGTTGGLGGTAGSSGAEAGAPGDGGTAALGGASAAGGLGDGGSVRGGSGGSHCAGCQPLEQCFDGLCVSLTVSVPPGFGIDATEVTRGQYAAWLATSPSTDGQATECAWNTAFDPDAICMDHESVCHGDDCDQHPQPCVDMCDAIGYCAAVGKRLCGAIDGGTVHDRRDPAESQFYNACTSNGLYESPFGESAEWGLCNDFTTFSETTVPVASASDCQSPEPEYAGIYDLQGNLNEWEDNCNDSLGEEDTCHVRGGSFGGGAAWQSCDYELYAERNDHDVVIGFRCCTD
jgi:sulfatase modifying factor 1